jgi:hypothetical protein
MKNATVLFFITWLFFLASSCQKEYSYEGGPANGGQQPENFVLEGAPNSCFDFVLNGNYNPGIALNIDNTVSVMVNVTTVGPYSIKTETIDGISFSKSGTFTSTGSQEVILQGTGKPLSNGTFVFTPNTGFSSCTFDVTVTNKEPTASYELATNADGTCGNYLAPGSYYHGTPLNNNVIVVTVNVNAPGDFNINTNTVNGITFSRTGNFITTGLQKVQLIGRGTPKEIGVFVFTPYIVIDGSPVGNGCNLDVYVF